MKDILIIHTGGTIGTFATEKARELNKEGLNNTKLILTANFAESNSEFAKHSEKLKFSDYPIENTTLSESMTLEKLCLLIKHISDKDFDKYDGIIVLHGTDTLAYTAALLAFAFSSSSIPIVLVSGNRPPADSLSNANHNFAAAVELIWRGLAPNVYVTYKNSDGIMRLYLGSAIMQSENYTDDFRAVCNKKAFDLSNNIFTALESCKKLSQSRKNFKETNVKNIKILSEQVLLIKPHTNLNYSVYKNCFSGNNPYKAVVHGTYHSGTVSYTGDNSPYSIGFLTEMCSKAGVPVFIAPSFLGSEQYETMNKVVGSTNAVLLNTTTEAAYAKLIVALSANMSPNQIYEYMNTEINNEFN